jgi:hypothetical protein
MKEKGSRFYQLADRGLDRQTAAFEGQFLPTAKGVNPSKGKLFDIVTCLKSGLVEFSHPLDQCLQARCHLRFVPLILNLRWKEMLVRPLGFGIYANMEPLSGGTFLAAPECSVQVFLLAVAVQCEPDPREDMFIITSRIVEVSEQTGIRRNHGPTFIQHAKATERSDGIQV